VIIAAILGLSDKPTLGSLPAYASTLDRSMGSLSAIDSSVLKLACEEALKIGHGNIDSSKVYILDGQPRYPIAELRESLNVLEHSGLLKLIDLASGAGIPDALITGLGFDTYAKDSIVDYPHIVSKVAQAIVNKQIDTNEALAQEVDRELMLIDHILDSLGNDGHIKLAEYSCDFRRIYNVLPVLRRSIGS